MARGDRRRTVREETAAGQSGSRPVQLREGRRFYSAQGHDQPVRVARALQNAFKTGTQLAEGIIDERNLKGGQQAAADFATGDKDEQNKVKGYLDAWDQLDAEADLNLMKKELPEVLRGANWEEMSEEDAQAFINDYMTERFQGMNPESAYAQSWTPGALALNQELLGVHRDMQLQNIQTMQTQTIVTNLESRFAGSAQVDENGEPIPGTEQFDYDYLAEQTRIFFDGPEKRTKYIESLAHFAMKNGRPDILENAPDRFESGDPTGLRADPLQYQRYVDAAYAQQARMAQKSQAAAEARDTQTVGQLQVLIAEAAQSGEDFSMYVDRLEGMVFDGRAKFSDLTAAKNFGDGQYDRHEEQSPNYTIIPKLWEGIHTGDMGMQEIMQAMDAGYLGYGKEATTLFNQMMNKVKTLTPDEKDALSDPAVTQYRAQITRHFNPATTGVVGQMDKTRFYTQNYAIADFNERVMAGENPAEVYQAVMAKFGTILDARGDAVDVAVNVGSGIDYIRKNVLPIDTIKARIENGEGIDDLVSGVPDAQVDDILTEYLDSGQLSEQQVEFLIN